MQELLKFKMHWSRPYVLVRWVGHAASGDTWEPLDNLTTCEEAAAPRRRRPPPPRRRRFRRQVSPWTSRRLAILVRRLWG